MKVYFGIVLILLTSCGDDSNSSTPNTMAKSIVDLNENSTSDYISDSTSYVKDSTSYIIGHKISQQFQGQKEISSLNKDLILDGFQDEIGSYDKTKCFETVEKAMAMAESSMSQNLSNDFAVCAGRLTKNEFILKMEEVDATYLIDESMLTEGFKDGLRLQNIFDGNKKREEELFSQLNRILEVKQSQAFIKNKLKGIEFMNENRSKKGILETNSGIQYKILRNGKGAYPSATSRVKVNYKGSMHSGEEFDSSYKRGQPSEFGLNQVIPGWTEGIQLMRPGSKFIFYIPQELAYGANPDPRSGIKPYSLLIFEVELLEIL
jgi:FKBP-type peptidyl-prolyl cis-trans isomerase